MKASAAATTSPAATLYRVVPQPWEPRPEQRLGIKWLLEHAGAGIFADPGVGKTTIVLAATKILLKQKLLRRVLVIAPLRVCYQVWPAEQKKWEDFAHLRVVLLHGKHKEQALEQDADIYVINPDGLDWLMAESRFKRLGVDTLVVDESSKFKKSNTKRFKLLATQLSTFARRWILTGSPTPNGYLDLFGQLYIVDLGHALGRYITHYRFQYFYPTGYGGYTWVIKPNGEKDIQKAIAPYIIRMEGKDLPTVVDNVIRVELPDDARKVYDELEEDMFTQLDGGEIVTAVSAGAAQNKCSQVANGGLYHHKAEQLVLSSSVHAAMAQLATGPHMERESKVIHNAKTEALMDLVDELNGSPLLVGFEFTHDRERIQAAVGKQPVPYIAGGVTPKRSAEIEREWNAGKIPLLLGHPASMGHGLNFQEGGCRHIAWYGITWDYELYDQFIRRVRRSGNKAADVFVHHIVARETVDEAKMRALKKKARGQNALLAALKDYRRSRRG